jgi:hypothetical protein
MSKMDTIEHQQLSTTQNTLSDEVRLDNKLKEL